MDSLNIKTSRTHYDILGLKPTCTAREIRNAYIRLCKQLHPDVCPGDAAQHKRFIELNDAYATLINEESRSIYDRSICRGYQNVSSWNHSKTVDGNEMKQWQMSGLHRNPDFNQNFQGRHVYKKVEGVRNIWIILGCFSLMVAGSLLYFSVYRFSKNHVFRKADQRSQKISLNYESTKKNIIETGAAAHKEKLKKMWKESGS